MTVEENYEATIEAETYNNEYDEDRGCGCRICGCKTDTYTLSNEHINEIREKVRERAKHKGLNEEQEQDAFVVAMIDAGCPQDEAEEICELYERTSGEMFDGPDEDEEDDDPDMPDMDEDDLDGDGLEDDEEEEDDIIEV